VVPWRVVIGEGGSNTSSDNKDTTDKKPDPEILEEVSEDNIKDSSTDDVVPEVLEEEHTEL